MAYSIHERLWRRYVCIQFVCEFIHNHGVHIEVYAVSDVLKLDHRMLFLHHQRLDPNHRNLDCIHKAFALGHNMDHVRNCSCRDNIILILRLRWRHFIRTSQLQRLREGSNILLLLSSHGWADPHDTDQTAHPSLNQFVDTRSLFFKDECLCQCGSKEYDGVSSLIPLLYNPLLCLLKRTDQGSHPERWQRYSCFRDGNNYLSVLMVAMASTGCIIILSLPQTHIEHRWPYSDTRLGIPSIRYCSLNPRRAGSINRRL